MPFAALWDLEHNVWETPGWDLGEWCAKLSATRVWGKEIGLAMSYCELIVVPGVDTTHANREWSWLVKDHLPNKRNHDKSIIHILLRITINYNNNLLKATVGFNADNADTSQVAAVRLHHAEELREGIPWLRRASRAGVFKASGCGWKNDKHDKHKKMTIGLE